MARRTKPQDADLSLVESTGAVEFDGEPVTVEQPAENQSTGNVEYVAPGTTEVTHYTEDVVIRAETPGPVTVNFPGLPGVANKVITSPGPEAVAEDSPEDDDHGTPAEATDEAAAATPDAAGAAESA